MWACPTPALSGSCFLQEFLSWCRKTPKLLPHPAPHPGPAGILLGETGVPALALVGLGAVSVAAPLFVHPQPIAPGLETLQRGPGLTKSCQSFGFSVSSESGWHGALRRKVRVCSAWEMSHFFSSGAALQVGTMCAWARGFQGRPSWQHPQPSL